MNNKSSTSESQNVYQQYCEPKGFLQGLDNIERVVKPVSQVQEVLARLNMAADTLEKSIMQLSEKLQPVSVKSPLAEKCKEGTSYSGCYVASQIDTVANKLGRLQSIVNSISSELCI